MTSGGEVAESRVAEDEINGLIVAAAAGRLLRGLVAAGTLFEMVPTKRNHRNER